MLIVLLFQFKVGPFVLLMFLLLDPAPAELMFVRSSGVWRNLCRPGLVRPCASATVLPQRPSSSHEDSLVVIRLVCSKNPRFLLDLMVDPW